MPLDPNEHNVKDLRSKVYDIDSATELQNLLDAEKEGKDRKTAKEAIESRLNAVGEQIEDSLSSLSDDANEEDAGPKYPDADADDLVVYDPTGSGDTGTAEPPIHGHETVHLATDDGEAVCGSPSAHAMTVPRSSLSDDIDECQRCR